MRIAVQTFTAATLVGALAAGSAAAQEVPPIGPFSDTWWTLCQGDCEGARDHAGVDYHRIHLRADGYVGYQRVPEDEVIYDMNDRWRQSDQYLVLFWTDGWAVNVFDTTAPGNSASRYEGTSTYSDLPAVIELRKP